MSASEKGDDKVRLDKWLWVVRFFKTQALAKAAIEDDRVYCRGRRCKPGREFRVGEGLTTRTGFDKRTVIIHALSAVQCGASEARALCKETMDSMESRERAVAIRKIGVLGIQTEGQSNRRQWRQTRQLRGGQD